MLNNVASLILFVAQARFHVDLSTDIFKSVDLNNNYCLWITCIILQVDQFVAVLIFMLFSAHGGFSNI